MTVLLSYPMNIKAQRALMMAVGKSVNQSSQHKNLFCVTGFVAKFLPREFFGTGNKNFLNIKI